MNLRLAPSLLRRVFDNKAIALLLVGILSCLGAQAQDYKVSWESEFNLPPQDSNGWSILTPSSDSRLIYVSSTDGNNSTAQVYSASSPEIGSNYQNPTGNIRPFATYAEAVKQQRTGYPDYILFKRGDTFSGGLTAIRGRSITERSVITTYGSSTERPLLKTGGGSAVRAADGTYSAIIGIHFYSNQRDPDSPDFVGFNNVGGQKGLDATSDSGLHAILVEDCWFQYYDESTFQPAGGDYLYDIVLRRNLFTNNYPGPDSGHSQGIFAKYSSLLLEENIFYHNGWYCQAETCSIGAATIFNHNTYFSSVYNTIFRNNIFISPSSINTKFTSNPQSGFDQVVANNILLDNNLMIDAEVSISMGGNRDYDDGYRWRDIYVVNNVLMFNGRSFQTQRELGWGIEARDWQTGIISGNVLTSWGSELIVNTYGINVNGHMGNVSVDQNIMYNIRGGGLGRPMLTVNGIQNSNSIRVNNNHLIHEDPAIDSSLASIGDYTGLAVSNNTYFSTLSSQSDWFSGAGLDSSGGTDSYIGIKDYIEPERTVLSYMSYLGRAATMDAFVDEVTKQSKAYWRNELTAQTINNYIRSGFCIDGEPCETPQPPSPPMPPSSLEVNIAP